MAILGKAQGVFRLADSDSSVGSFLSKEDIKLFLGVNDADLGVLEFEVIDGIEVIDEIEVQKAWYSGKIKNAPPVGSSSLDEFLLLYIVSKALPGCEIETQVKVKRFKMDLKITYQGKSLFVEFDGPSHLAISPRYGPPKHEPFRKKKIVEEETNIEVVNWAYWIQRCESNVKVLFDERIKGYGVLWSTNVHFGDFYFDNSAEIIESINNRFNADHDGFGYFYGPNTVDRNNPEHPIVKNIISGHEAIGRLLPKGYGDKKRWLPETLQNII